MGPTPGEMKQAGVGRGISWATTWSPCQPAPWGIPMGWPVRAVPSWARMPDLYTPHASATGRGHPGRRETLGEALSAAEVTPVPKGTAAIPTAVASSPDGSGWCPVASAVSSEPVRGAREGSEVFSWPPLPCPPHHCIPSPLTPKSSFHSFKPKSSLAIQQAYRTSTRDDSLFYEQPTSLHFAWPVHPATRRSESPPRPIPLALRSPQAHPGINTSCGYLPRPVVRGRSRPQGR